MTIEKAQKDFDKLIEENQFIFTGTCTPLGNLIYHRQWQKQVKVAWYGEMEDRLEVRIMLSYGYPLVVVKRNGNRESFDKSKLIKGLIRACEKRPVSLPQMEQIAGDIEQQLQEGGSKEVSTNQIGEMVMDRLKVLDEVAYVRFASVYRRFTDSGSFVEEVNRLHTGKDRE